MLHVSRLLDCFVSETQALRLYKPFLKWKKNGKNNYSKRESHRYGYH